MFRVPKGRATVGTGQQPSSLLQTRLPSIFTHHITINEKSTNNKPQQTTQDTIPSPIKTTPPPTSTPLLYQTDIQGRSIEKHDLEAFGDLLGKKEANVFRIMLQNVNNLPVSSHVYRSRQLVDCISNQELDVYLMTEVGLCWNKLSAYDQWYERTTGRLTHQKSIFSYNKTELHQTKSIQHGGVGICTTDEGVHRVLSTGEDSSGLGRWAWVRLQGKAGRTIRIITAYRPCGAGGEGTVWEQHQRHFGTQEPNQVINPRSQFLTDLRTAITDWQAAGDYLILGMDANEDVRHGDAASMMTTVSMHEAILAKHSSKSPPATYNRNYSRQPIDGIWVSDGLEILRGGYTEFGGAAPSDHRALWVDFHYTELFGHSILPTVKPSARRLNANDPRLAETYNQLTKQAFRKNKLFKKLTLLSAALMKDGLLPKHEQEFNSIQLLQTSLRKEIEKDLRRLRMGGISWSPKLQRYRDQIELWMMVTQKRRRVKVSTKRVRCFMRRLGITHALKVPLSFAERELKMALIAYKAAKKNADVWRDDHIHSLAEARAAKKGTTVEAEQKALTHHARQKRQALRVKAVRNKLRQGGVIKLYTLNNDGTIRELTTKKEMEHACMIENEDRFSQSSDTPFMTQPLLSDFGYLADTAFTEQILQGTYQVPTDTDKYAALLLKELQKIDSSKIPSIPTTLTVEEHIDAWKKQKEMTSSEPSGLTFSHYKAASEDRSLATFDTALRSIPYQYGFAPAQWKQMTDVELLKKANVYDVTKMRTILLMNSEFNINNKKLARDVMKQIEALNLVPREQYGSRKHLQAIYAALNKRLTMDLLRQRRQAGALCSNDAKSCYDRIVHAFAILCMLKFGVQLPPLISMFQCLQEADHKIRTAYGDSTNTYGGNRTVPLQGSGQGNGCGPATYVVISSIIIAMMKSEGFGAHFLTAMSLSLIHFVCYVFVDDSDVVHTGTTINSTGEEVAETMQKVVDHWEGGLRATGGALVADKSYWYLIDFEWKGNKWKYRKKDAMPGEIDIRSVDGASRIPLRRFEAAHAEETLGVFLAMDGNNTAETDKLLGKSKEFAECIRTGRMTRTNAWYAFNFTVMKTLEYPMVATTLTEDEWNKVMSPLLAAALPTSGINRKYPFVIVYSPLKFQGLGIIHPFYRQEINHLSSILQETSMPSITGDLLRANMEQLRLEVGLGGSLGDWSYSRYGTLATNCWIQTLWNFCSNNEVAIHDNCPHLETARSNDRYLNQLFVTFGYSGDTLVRLNECRMWLKTITVADITTADGRKITTNSWNGIRDNQRCNDFLWPRLQTRLGPKHWNTWRSALSECLLKETTVDRSLRLPLGAWTKPVSPNWTWFYCRESHNLYCQKNQTWVEYSPQLNQRSTRNRKYVQGEHCNPPPSLQLASCQKQRNVVYLLSHSTPFHPTHSNLSNTTLKELHTTSLSKWSIHDFVCIDDGQELASAIQQGLSKAVSDGSFKDQRGTSAFSLFGCTEEPLFIGWNGVPGSSKVQSAYRSELAGVAGIITAVELLCARFSITEGAIEIGLDGSEALNQSRGDWPLSPKQADFDMLTDIRSRLARSPITWHWHWIRGHQDKHKPLRFLDFWAKNNVYMDNMAKAFMAKTIAQDMNFGNIRFEQEGWSVSYRQEKLSRLTIGELYSDITSAKSLQYWIDKGQITLTTSIQIDWSLIDTAMKRVPISRRIWLSKQACGHCAVGVVLQRRRKQDHDHCPRCGESETASHVLICQDERAIKKWNYDVTILNSWLIDRHTAPAIRLAIIQNLRRWKRQLPPTINSLSTTLATALATQSAIGWNNLLIGRMSDCWAPLQQQYFTSLGKKTTGRSWAVSLLVQLWQLSWNQWDHRNDIDKNTIHPEKQARLEILNDLIRTEYDLGPTNLLNYDRQFFRHPLSTTLQKKDETQKRQWLDSVHHARRRTDLLQQQSRDSLYRERNLMENWLGLRSNQ